MAHAADPLALPAVPPPAPGGHPRRDALVARCVRAGTRVRRRRRVARARRSPTVVRAAPGRALAVMARRGERARRDHRVRARVRRPLRRAPGAGPGAPRDQGDRFRRLPGAEGDDGPRRLALLPRRGHALARSPLPRHRAVRRSPRGRCRASSRGGTTRSRRAASPTSSSSCRRSSASIPSTFPRGSHAPRRRRSTASRRRCAPTVGCASWTCARPSRPRRASSPSTTAPTRTGTCAAPPSATPR